MIKKIIITFVVFLGLLTFIFFDFFVILGFYESIKYQIDDPINGTDLSEINLIYDIANTFTIAIIINIFITCTIILYISIRYNTKIKSKIDNKHLIFKIALCLSIFLVSQLLLLYYNYSKLKHQLGIEQIILDRLYSITKGMSVFLIIHIFIVCIITFILCLKYFNRISKRNIPSNVKK